MRAPHQAAVSCPLHRHHGAEAARADSSSPDHDTLTGLHNPASFRRAEERSSAKRRGTTVAIMCLDLDHFKECERYARSRGGR